MADTSGRFVLVPPQAGEYVVEATRIGHEPTRSPLFAMAVEGRVPFDLLMRPRPVGLEGLEVSAEARDLVARRLLGSFGQSPASLGRRWIDRAALESLPSSGEYDPGVAIQWQAVPLEGIAVLRPDDAATFYGTQGNGGAVLLWTKSSGR